MKIAIVGSSGLVGSALKEFFLKSGHSITAVKRDFQLNDFEDADVVINLAGESISRRWNEAVKKEIRDSRINTTRRLSAILQQKPPKLVINASAIGYYGSSDEKTFNETSQAGSNFLADVVKDWEDALQIDGSRIVFARFGMILSREGGALSKMLPPFKMGLGGVVGSGKQFMSWIAIEDVICAIHHVIHHEDLSGPINFVSPHPVTNEVFTKMLGEQLNRPTLIPVPETAIKLIFGEMGEEVLLSSCKVEPTCLLKSGYPFLYPDLKEALKREL